MAATAAAATHRLVLPGWHPTPLNRLLRGHWGRGAALKKADRERVFWESRAQAIPKASGQRRVSLVLTLGPRQRGCDVDAYWKSLLDALTFARLIVDDGPRWCEIGEVTYERGECRGCVVILEDVASPAGRRGTPRA